MTLGLVTSILCTVMITFIANSYITTIKVWWTLLSFMIMIQIHNNNHNGKGNKFNCNSCTTMTTTGNLLKMIWTWNRIIVKHRWRQHQVGVIEYTIRIHNFVVRTLNSEIQTGTQTTALSDHQFGAVLSDFLLCNRIITL